MKSERVVLWEKGGVSQNGRILLANSEASEFRLVFHFFEGVKAWKKLGGNLGFMVMK
jgi:hypothetical protein